MEAKRMVRLFNAILFFSLLIAFGRPIYADDNSKYFKGDFDEEKALKLIYGNYDKTKDVSNWSITAKERELYKIDEDWTDLFARTMLIESYIEDNIQKRILITKSSAYITFESCHGCGVIISGAV